MKFQLCLMLTTLLGFTRCARQPAAPTRFVTQEGTSTQYNTQDSMGNYQFGYDVSHTTGSSFHKESGSPGVKVGSYGLRDIDGRVRVVNYVADSQGFRADVQSNEPGVVSKDSAGVTISRTPSIQPLPAVGFTINEDDDLSALGVQEPGDGSPDPDDAGASSLKEQPVGPPAVDNSPPREAHAGDTVPDVPVSEQGSKNVAASPAEEASKDSSIPTPEAGQSSSGYPQYPPAARPFGVIGHGVGVSPGTGAGQRNPSPGYAFDVMLHPGYPAHGHGYPEHPWRIPPFAEPHGYGLPGQEYPYHAHPGFYPYLPYGPNHYGYAGPQWNYYDVPLGVQRFPHQMYAQAPFGYSRPALGVNL